MDKRRLMILAGIFVILTVISGIHMYNSFKRILEMPENIPSLNEKIPEGFWLDFGLIYYFSPIKTIALIFSLYAASLFLVDYINKNFIKTKNEKQK